MTAKHVARRRHSAPSHAAPTFATTRRTAAGLRTTAVSTQRSILRSVPLRPDAFTTVTRIGFYLSMGGQNICALAWAQKQKPAHHASIESCAAPRLPGSPGRRVVDC